MQYRPFWKRKRNIEVTLLVSFPLLVGEMFQPGEVDCRCVSSFVSSPLFVKAPGGAATHTPKARQRGTKLFVERVNYSCSSGRVFPDRMLLFIHARAVLWKHREKHVFLSLSLPCRLLSGPIFVVLALRFVRRA